MDDGLKGLVAGGSFCEELVEGAEVTNVPVFDLQSPAVEANVGERGHPA